MATTMTIPFYLDIGYTNTEIGTVVKNSSGFWATIFGTLPAGSLTLKIGMYLSLYGVRHPASPFHGMFRGIALFWAQHPGPCRGSSV
ncbi:MAG: hypothetical protein R2861_15310 [Desulfobacterales bacterium]